MEKSEQTFWPTIDFFICLAKEELKSLLRKVKEESEKAGLKLSIQKMKTVASSPSTSWQIDGEFSWALKSL